MVFCGLALLAVLFGNLIVGEDADMLLRDKKTLSSFILFFGFKFVLRDLAGVAALGAASALTTCCKS